MSVIDVQEEHRAQKKSVDCLVFSGGGAKGAMYSGVMESLSVAGVLTGVQAVAGSSAGAITAALIATGISSEDFAKISSDVNFTGLLGSGNALSLGLLLKDGKPLHSLVQKTIASSAAIFLMETDIESLCVKRLVEIANETEFAQKSLSTVTNEEDAQKLTEQLSYLESSKILLEDIATNQSPAFQDLKKRCAKGGDVLFKDLEMLRILSPTRFKDLLVTAVRKEDGELTIFSTKTTPNVSIADAVRASSGLPLLFQSWKIGEHHFVDGGYRDNVPVKYFDDHSIKDLTRSPDANQTSHESAAHKSRMLAFAFGGGTPGSDTNIAVYGRETHLKLPNLIKQFVVDVLYKVLTGVQGTFRHTQTEKETYERLSKDPLSVVPLSTESSGVGTISFARAQNVALILHIKGEIETSRHLLNHGIIEDKSQSFPIREFLFTICEPLIASGKVANREHLLKFGKKDLWESKDKYLLVADWLVEAASSANPKLSTKTHTVSNLIKALNKSDASLEIKEIFIKVLKVDTAGKSARDYQIQERDVQKWLDQNQHRATHQAKHKAAIQAKSSNQPKSPHKPTNLR